MNDPLTCVAIGTGKALEYMDKITRISKNQMDMNVNRRIKKAALAVFFS